MLHPGTRAGGEGGGTPYDSLYGEAPPERSTLFRLKVYERVGILPGDVYKRVGNLSFGSVKAPKELTDEFYGFKKSRKRSIFLIDSYLKDSTFTAVTRDASTICQKKACNVHLFREEWYITTGGPSSRYEGRV